MAIWSQHINLVVQNNMDSHEFFKVQASSIWLRTINLVLSIELIWYGTQMFKLWLTLTNLSISSRPTKHLDLSIISVVIRTSQFNPRLTSWWIDTLCWSGLSCIIQLWSGHRLRIDAVQKRFLRIDFFVKLCYTVEFVIKFIASRLPGSTFRIWCDD